MHHIYERLINRFMREFWLKHRSEADSGETDYAQHFRPFITVSREPGSGGRPIAQLVAKKLKFRFYDNQIISDIAKSTKLRRSIVEAVDEKGRGLIADMIHGLFNPDYLSDVDYMRELCKVILSVAYKGNAVIVGHGSNFITPNSAGLHVRITAPYRVRLRRSMKYENLSLEAAKKRLKEIETDRTTFVKQYFAKDINEPKYYDLTLNTTFYNLDQSAHLIIAAFKLKFSRGTM